MPPRATAGQFSRAETLLRLILHDLEATVQNREHHADRGLTALRLRHLEAENARLHTQLNGRLPNLPAQPAPPTSGDHAQQVVGAMLGFVREHYHHPMSLREIALHLKMTPNYLSTLFHETLGVTFHHYLEALRIAAAEDLLRDPTVHVCEVAAAVGYATANHFRSVFRRRYGHSPRARSPSTDY